MLKVPSEQKQDVFDQPDFDAIKFINQIYPDGAFDGPPWDESIDGLLSNARM